MLMKKAKTDFKKQGKRNRASGARFERKVRADLESKGWIVIKNPNNVIDGKFKQGKPKFNPFTKTLMMNSGGFPDFICYRNNCAPYLVKIKDIKINHDKIEQKITPILNHGFEINAVECKSNGTLSKEEKEKCKWLNEKIFSKILIASKGKKRGEVVYKEFK